MNAYTLSHLTDHDLLHHLAALVVRDRATTAALLAHLAEVDARRLYLPAAYPSMHEYCVHELHLSEEAAFKRIHAARAARRVPSLFAAVADGRLHLSGVLLLAPHLTAENVDELIAAAAYQTKAGIENLLARRFPRPDVPARVQPIGPTPSSLVTDEHAPGRVLFTTAQLSPGRVEAPRAKVAPLSPERFSLQLTMGQGLYDKLRYAQALLSHQIPSGDVAQVLERALDALIEKLEQRKFAATTRPCSRQQHSNTGGRHIPAAVRRAVWERDGGRCTFVSETGHRCPARTFLEFDHVDEVARGGEATVDGIRLRCRAHNQYAAECTFGAEFMEYKRQAARQAAEERRAAQRAAAEARARAEAEARARAAAAEERAQEVVPWLRQLGFRADEARRAAALCESIPDAPLEERVRLALSYFHPRASSHGAPRAASGLGTAA
jgi:hypothetical protein